MMTDRAAQQTALDWEADLQVFHLQQRSGIRRQRQRIAHVLRRQQLLGVRMQRLAKQADTVVLLNALALAHHRHVVRQATHNIQVVGDKQQPHAHFLLQLLQQQ
ncbi:hypothetical protein D3C80_881860 [compost metagenome]